MLFNTIDYLIFLPTVVLVYYLIPFRFRWVFMLAASYYFYMCWRVEYIVLILASTVIDYFVAQLLYSQQDERKRKWLLWLSLATNLGLLFVFKYFNFATESINLAFDKFNITKHIPGHELLLPVGISFYTFQTLSYTLDVYYKKQKAEKHFGYFALYVSYFPQLVAGPIERFSRLNEQLKAKVNLNYGNLSNGFRLILFGLFVKMVIADNISPIVDSIYKEPEIYSSANILLGMVLYSFQIYCDFHGYSSIAIGTALLFGVELMNNFNTPYLATSIKEFWERWHISLSTWFRDYLYIPLGGNKVGVPRWMLNILIVFAISGLWHGANWTFVIWGSAYGVLYLIEHWINKLLNVKEAPKKLNAKRVLLAAKTFLLVTFIWVFFRSENLAQANDIFSALFSNYNVDYNLELSNIWLVWFGIFLIFEVILFNKRFDSWLSAKPFAFRWLVYGALIFGVSGFAGVEDYPFIYFQF